MQKNSSAALHQYRQCDRYAIDANWRSLGNAGIAALLRVAVVRSS
jgi:hypothetical protein